ncbi:hypothetical protein M422DRAFT_275003 [Sphaerobolus stellatus SS14]|uniref:Uncharacterized protein n=1 Tax=Sphaerobolus stellatus (strain SS14) TaxID=990650 RepID=A0A0C9T5R9_SPHS4|nr:hypothetical protein M422DRAFT_275003 [Sphaerobolus stellatus SS14]
MTRRMQGFPLEDDDRLPMDLSPPRHPGCGPQIKMTFEWFFKRPKYPLRSCKQTHSFEINGSSRNNNAGRDDVTIRNGGVGSIDYQDLRHSPATKSAGSQ